MIECAKKVFGEMKQNGLHPTIATYVILVNDFDLTKNPLEVRVIQEEIQQRIIAKSMEGGTNPFVHDEGLLDSLVEFFMRATLLGYLDTQELIKINLCNISVR